MILITGATGLTGAHLALHLLEHGEQVRAIFRDQASVEKTRSLFSLYKKDALFPNIDWIKADITDIPALTAAFHGVEYVYHCAALISFNPDDEERLRKANIEGTANVVNLCLAFGVRKLCHMSSVATLRDLKEGEREVTEENDWNPEKPHSDYAISKHGAEMEVWRGQQEGLSVVIVNPGIIIGPGFWDSASGDIFGRVARGISFYTKGKTGFVDVRDVAQIMRELMHSAISGERFIVTAETLSYEELINATADALKVKRPTIHADAWMLSFAWKADWMASVFGKKRTLSKDGARALNSVTYYRNSKIRDALDFTFRNIPESIRETAAYFPGQKK
jgi:dihydroflavonol-4-reductase